MSLRVRSIERIPAAPSEASRNEARLYWLGQAGFLIDFFNTRIVIDPYLSNSLNRKYQGTRFPHERMMEPPIAPEAITGVDWVVSTHGHTDHMDPETLRPLFEANPEARYLVPTAELPRAKKRSGRGERIIDVDADDEVALSDEVAATALPAAHEEEELDETGRHRFLGYIFRGRDVSIYHSGDTVPFDGLRRRLERQSPQLSLLPVNGRDELRRSHGVPGNMTLQEAVELLTNGLVGSVIGHHYGLFDFNTLDVDDAEVYLSTLVVELRNRVHLAGLGWEYLVTGNG